MTILDPYFRKVAEYIKQLEKNGGQLRNFDCPTDIDKLIEATPVRVGAKANPSIILRGDTFAELGSPDTSSCAFLIWTEDSSLLTNGKITLIGPDIIESEGASLPFAQVIMVGGAELSNEDHSALDHTQYISDQIEGYMIRSTTERMWSRISKDAAHKGLNFHTLGMALMTIFRNAIPHVQSIEILFITSSKEDVKQLDDIASQIHEISKNITREKWLAKGIDILECTIGGDCGSCSDKPVCDEIRDVITVRKKKSRTKGSKKAAKA